MSLLGYVLSPNHVKSCVWIESCVLVCVPTQYTDELVFELKVVFKYVSQPNMKMNQHIRFLLMGVLVWGRGVSPRTINQRIKLNYASYIFAGKENNIKPWFPKGLHPLM